MCVWLGGLLCMWCSKGKRKFWRYEDWGRERRLFLLCKRVSEALQSALGNQGFQSVGNHKWILQRFRLIVFFIIAQQLTKMFESWTNVPREWNWICWRDTELEKTVTASGRKLLSWFRCLRLQRPSNTCKGTKGLQTKTTTNMLMFTCCSTRTDVAE